MRYFIIVFMAMPDNNYYLATTEKGYKGTHYPNKNKLIEEIKSSTYGNSKKFSIINIIKLKSEEDYNNYFKQ